MRTLAKLLVFLVLASPALAQFGSGVSNLTVKGSLTPGYTDIATNGAIRWNPTLMVHQGYNGTNWVAIAGGAGSGFPLTENGDLAGFSLTNGGSVQATSVLARTIGTNSALPRAAVVSDGLGGHMYEYVPRAVTNRSQIAIAQASSNLPTLYPGQLVYNDVGSGAGNTYIQLRTLYPTNYFPYTTNQFPYSGESGDSTNFWKLFVEAGVDGNVGPTGPQGGDGIGNMRYGRWSSGFGYDYNTNSIWVVTDGEQWYDLIKTTGSTNDAPSLNTNVWRVSLRRGQDGTLTVISNLVERGAWNAIDTYNTNHVVQYMGNDFWVSPTNQQPAVGVPPGIDSDYNGTNTPYWSVRVSRGMRGVQGIPGAQNNFYNEYNTYPTFFTNPVINSPSATNPLPVYFDTVNGTDRFVYAGYIPSGTNRILVVGSNLYVNGLLFAPGNDALRHMAVSNVVESTSNKYDAATGLLVLNTNPPAVGSGNGNMIVTNEGSAGQIAYRSAADSNTVYWGAAPSGGLSQWFETTGTTTQAGQWLYTTTSNRYGIFVATNNGVVFGPRPDGTSAGGNAVGVNAFSATWGRNFSQQVASGKDAIAIGFRATASGLGGFAIGGLSGATASGQGSIAFGGIASGLSSIAMGQGAYAGGGGLNVAIGGFNATATGDYSVTISGNGTYTYGARSTAINAHNSTVRSIDATMIGGANNAITAGATNSMILHGMGITNSTANRVITGRDLEVRGGIYVLGFNSTNPAVAGYAQFSSRTNNGGANAVAEMFVVDSGGTETQLSSHDEDGNYYTHERFLYAGVGVKTWPNPYRREVYTFPALDWNAQEAARVADEMAAQAAWSNAVVQYPIDLAVWESLTQEERRERGLEPPRAPGDMPVVTPAKPPPVSQVNALALVTNPPGSIMVFSEGLETPVLVLQDSANTNIAYGYYSDSGELVGGILDHASPRDPVAIAQRIASNRVARNSMRIGAKSVKTNASAIVRSVRTTRQASTGLVDTVKSAQVGTNATTAAVRTGHRTLVDATETLAKDHRSLEAAVIALSQQVRELADLLRRSELRDKLAADEDTGE